MITITTERSVPRGAVRRRHDGFTMAEILIAATISSFVMAGVLSSFLMMGRSGANAYSYVGMESEARRGLEQFGEDVRMAKLCHWASSTDVTLYMTSGSAADPTKDVRYYYDSGSSSSNYQCMVRYGPDRVTGVLGTKALIHN